MAGVAQPRTATRRDALVGVLPSAAIIAVIATIAVVTRLSYLDLLEFRNDEATASLLAVGFLDGNGLPLTGIISSALINNPPFFVYLLAIPLAINRDPELAAGFVGLLGVGSVLLAYRFAVDHFDRRTGQIAALLFAAAPWAVILSRRLQGQDVVPFFTLLWVSALFNFVRGRGGFHLIGVTGWLSVLLQVHLATVALIPLTAIALGLTWRRFRVPGTVRWSIGALAAGFALWLPYLDFQLTHHWADLLTLRHVLAQTPQVSLDHFTWIVDLATSDGFATLAGTNIAAYRAATISFDGLILVERLLFYGGLAFLIALLIRHRGKAPGDWRLILLILWLVIPPLFFVRHTTPLFDFYFVDVFPAQFIVIGLLISSIEGWMNARISPVWASRFALAAFVVLTSIIAAQVYGFFTTMEFIATQPTPGGHDVPLREREAAVKQFVAAASNSTTPRYIAAHDADADAFGYLARQHLTYTIFDDRDTFVSPSDSGQPAAYLSAEPDKKAAVLLRQMFAPGRVALVPFPGEATGYEIYQVPATAGASLEHQPDVRPIGRSVTNGMRLVGFDLGPTATPGQPLQLAIYWQVDSVPPPGTDDSFFVHLVDDQGQTWAQQDSLDYPPASWTLGERVISWFTLTPRANLPIGRGWIEFGVYDRHGVRRLSLRSDDGALSDHIQLGPLKLIRSNVPPAPTPSSIQTPIPLTVVAK